MGARRVTAGLTWQLKQNYVKYRRDMAVLEKENGELKAQLKQASLYVARRCLSGGGDGKGLVRPADPFRTHADRPGPTQ